MKKNMMKVLKCIVALTFLMQGSAVLAQKPQKMTPEQRVDKSLTEMKTKLNLTDEQTAKVREMMITRQQQNITERKAIRAQQQQMKENNKVRNKAFQADMAKVLTPEQMKGFQQMRQEKVQQMKQMRGMKGAPGLKRGGNQQPDQKQLTPPKE